MPEAPVIPQPHSQAQLLEPGVHQSAPADLAGRLLGGKVGEAVALVDGRGG